MNRKPIFDAARSLLGRGMTQSEVAKLDAAIDDAITGTVIPAVPTARQINAAGLALVKSSEGLELKAYPDPGSGGDPWTIGYGHTGPDVHPGMIITEARAEELLHADLHRFEADVAKLAPVATDNQFSAMVCFHYNTGALGKSTLLKKHNAGDYAGAALEFAKWVNASGRVLPGLIKRRAAEAQLYRTVS